MKTLYTITLALLIFSCQSGEKSVKTLSPQDFSEAIKNNPEGALLDVRTPGEVASGKINGAINFDFNSTDFQRNIEALDRSKTYFLYCASGKRSGKAQQMMSQMGFEKVTTLEGGFNSWKAAGMPVSNP